MGGDRRSLEQGSEEGVCLQDWHQGCRLIRKQFYVENFANWVENGIICNSKALNCVGTFIMYFGEIAIVSIISEKNTHNDLSKTLAFQFFINCLLYIVSIIKTFVIRCVHNCDNLMTSPYTILF